MIPIRPLPLNAIGCRLCQEILFNPLQRQFHPFTRLHKLPERIGNIDKSPLFKHRLIVNQPHRNQLCLNLMIVQTCQQQTEKLRRKCLGMNQTAKCRTDIRRPNTRLNIQPDEPSPVRINGMGFGVILQRMF